MIASRRDAQRPLRGAHAHDWIPNHPGSGQSICTLCWATTWSPEAWPTTVSPFVRRAREGRLPAKVLS